MLPVIETFATSLLISLILTAVVLLTWWLRRHRIGRTGHGSAAAEVVCESRPAKDASSSSAVEVPQDTYNRRWPAATTGPLPKGRVLLLDDEEFIRALATKALSGSGYIVDAVADGRQAVTRYRRALDAGVPYDLAVLDLSIPGSLNGIETFQRLRAIDPDVRAVVSGADASDPIVAGYQDHGFLGSLIKPYGSIELLKTVDTALRSRGITQF
jgi:CheY-like chemotaxis protein